ncbi:MAG: P-loop NTPase [SAR324 cluster bacterium]|nr:P-loop NTPase [SAR324 cluster bacterium]
MKKPIIWAIGGGKGGVGKSVLSGNLGIALAKKRKQVVLIDSDLGGANLHTCLGIANPQMGLSDFLSKHIRQLKDVVVPTTFPYLSLISGARDSLNVSNPKHTQKLKILRAIRNLETEHIILDLGAGSNFNTLDFFLAADIQVIVVVPEPTSIENAYRFVKSSFYRQIRQKSPNSSIRSIVDQTIGQSDRLGFRNPHEFLAHLRTMGSEIGEFVDEQVLTFNPKLIVNQIRSSKDRRIGFAMRNACAKYFGIQLDFAGSIEYDDNVRQSIIKRQPLLEIFPQSSFASGVLEVCDNLLYGRFLESEKLS